MRKAEVAPNGSASSLCKRLRSWLWETWSHRRSPGQWWEERPEPKSEPQRAVTVEEGMDALGRQTEEKQEGGQTLRLTFPTPSGTWMQEKASHNTRQSWEWCTHKPRSTGQTGPWRPQEGTGPAMACISDLWLPPEWWENSFWCFKPSNLLR